MKDLFWNDTDKTIEINIYADESKSRKDEYWNIWHYIWIIIDKSDDSLLNEIENERIAWNLTMSSDEKYNKKLHWNKISSMDEKNICERWFKYILDNKKNWNFYGTILWINTSLLSNKYFWNKNFNIIYNRFFRTAIIYSIKAYFPWNKIIIKNIFHEVWEQENYDIFSTHCIKKINELDENIFTECDEIIFLWKDHNQNRHATLIQLCDVYLWVILNIIHWCEDYSSNRFVKYKKKLMDLMLPLIERLINNPKNKNSKFNYYKHQSISFFPKEPHAMLWDLNRQEVINYINGFYTDRKIKYKEDLMPYKQISLF